MSEVMNAKKPVATANAMPIVAFLLYELNSFGYVVQFGEVFCTTQHVTKGVKP